MSCRKKSCMPLSPRWPTLLDTKKIPPAHPSVVHNFFLSAADVLPDGHFCGTVHTGTAVFLYGTARPDLAASAIRAQNRGVTAPGTYPQVWKNLCIIWKSPFFLSRILRPGGVNINHAFALRG